MNRNYVDSVLVQTDGPFGGQLIRAEGALCPDGRRRTARPSRDGVAVDFETIPAFVYAGGRRVYGYVTLSGYGAEETLVFNPYLFRSHAHLVLPKPEWKPIEGLVTGDNEQPGPLQHRWQCYIVYSEDGAEECDVNARTYDEAIGIARQYAERDLESGWTQILAEQRVGMYY